MGYSHCCRQEWEGQGTTPYIGVVDRVGVVLHCCLASASRPLRKESHHLPGSPFHWGAELLCQEVLPNTEPEILI